MVLTGYGLHECRYRRGGKQVDFTLWVDDVARFAVQVKGGKYDLDDYGNWSLRMPDGGPKGVPSPLAETEDGCMEMRDGIRKATSYTNFVVGVLMFPDMEPDRRMGEAAGKRIHVYIIWGLDHLSEDLERIAKRAPYKRPLSHMAIEGRFLARPAGYPAPLLQAVVELPRMGISKEVYSWSTPGPTTLRCAPTAWPALTLPIADW